MAENIVVALSVSRSTGNAYQEWTFSGEQDAQVAEILGTAESALRALLVEPFRPWPPAIEHK